MTAASLLSALLLTGSILGILYCGLAALLVRRLAHREPPAPAVLPSVTVLKPLHGAEPRLAENLETFCLQDYGGPVQLVFGVQTVSDPAIRVVEALRRLHPALAIDVVVDARQHGSNRKVSNLVNMSGAIRHDVVVLADSDMAVAPDYLRRVVAELARPGVGAVTCLYHGVAVGGSPSRLAALGIDSHFLPAVAVGTGLGLAKPCFGSTIALRSETLRAIGGFPALANDLADDYVLGEKVRGLGLAVALSAFTVGHSCPENSVRDLLRQELRWARTVRQIDPLGHAGSVISHPLPLALLAWMVEPGAGPVLAAIAAIAARVGLCLAAERVFGLRPHPYRLVPARDLLSFGVFLASFGGRGVSWRGHSYDVDAAGVMTSKDEALNPR